MSRLYLLMITTQMILGFLGGIPMYILLYTTLWIDYEAQKPENGGLGDIFMIFPILYFYLFIVKCLLEIVFFIVSLVQHKDLATSIANLISFPVAYCILNVVLFIAALFIPVKNQIAFWGLSILIMASAIYLNTSCEFMRLIYM